jgi:hypothetical protein
MSRTVSLSFFVNLPRLNDITSVMKSDVLMFVILFSIQRHMQLTARGSRQEASCTVSQYLNYAKEDL